MGVFQYFVEQPITPVWVGSSKDRALYVVCYSMLQQGEVLAENGDVCVIVWGGGGGGGGGVPP